MSDYNEYTAFTLDIQSMRKYCPFEVFPFFLHTLTSEDLNFMI